MSLYLKYRPQDFKSVVGQDHIVATLKNAIRHHSLTHAYLFSGPRGTGKTSLARILAKSLNCTDLQEGSEPCNRCENCEGILTGRMVDLIEIDAASNRGIDEIRELRDKIMFAPNQGSAKIYIIDEVHMLTKEAFNALLKTLEEPPSHAYFILATTEFHKIPETIISRCQQFSFKRISKEAIVKRLEYIADQEKVQAEPDALELIAKISSGGLRDAIGLFEQMTIDGAVIYQEVVAYLGITGHMMIEAFFEALLNKEAAKAIEMINQINGQGQDLNQFCRELITYLREQMLLGLNDKEEVGNIIRYIDIFSAAKSQINQALIPQLPLEIAVMKACGYENKTEEAVAEKEEGGEKRSSVHEGRAAGTAGTISDPLPEKPEKKEPANPDDLTIETVKENWQRVAENIETPFIRMSFMDSDPIKLEKGILHLSFKSSTLMEKVAKPTNQGEILKAFEKVLSSKVTLRLELKKVDLKPVKEEDKKEEIPSVIEMAKEVFGQ
ncbi:DNA polymerase III subunit gamma/tau [Candidatus Peregrinibacteria bacterium]|nr:DNA polymerase III subunit gamma/tau [Candidatus Peregrinibacteria bacterium]